MFHTDFIAYKRVPDLKTIESIVDSGYRVYINQKDRVDDTLCKLRNVTCVDLPAN